MAESATNEATRRFPTHPTSGHAVRRFVRDLLDGCDDREAVDLIVLLTDELVSNAVGHARTPFVVTVRILDERVRVEVEDGNTRLPIRQIIPADANSGRGLTIVETVADRWGFEAREGGKVVWFEYAPLDVPLPRG